MLSPERAKHGSRRRIRFCLEARLPRDHRASHFLSNLRNRKTALLDSRQRLLVSRHATPPSFRMPRGSGDRSNGDTAAVAGRDSDRWCRLPARRTAWPRQPRGRNLRGGLCVRRLCLPISPARNLHLTELQLDPTSIKVQWPEGAGGIGPGKNEADERRCRYEAPQKTSSASTGSSR